MKQKIEVDISLDRKDPRTYDLIVRTPQGFLKGEIGESDSIAESFGSKSNLARYELLRSFNAPTAWIFKMEVEKPARGRGIGTRLMKAALDAMMESGVEYVVLSPRPDSMDDWDRLVRFYKKFGFEEFKEFGKLKLWSMLMVKKLPAKELR